MEKLSVYLCFVCFTSFAIAQSWKQLDSLAYVYTDTNPDSAIVLSQKAISLCKKEKNPVEYGLCLGTMAYAQYKAGHKKKADSIFKESLSIFESRPENLNTDEYATTLNLYGIFNETILNYKVSYEAYSKALSIRLDKIKQDSVRCADLFNNLGSLTRRMGRLSEAEHYQKIAIKMYEKRLTQKSHVSPDAYYSYYKSIKNLCHTLEDKGDIKQAEDLYQKLLNDFKKSSQRNDELYILLLHDMGVFYGKMGKIEYSEKLLYEALKILENLKGKNNKNYFSIVNSMAMLYIYHKIKLSQAEILLKELAKIFSGQPHKENDLDYLYLTNNLGMLYLYQKNYEKAEKQYLYLLPLLEKKLGKKTSIYASTLNNMAGVYENMNKLGLSESLYKESIDIKKSIFGENTVQVAHSLSNLAKVYFLKKQYALSDSTYSTALSILKKYYPPYHVDILTRLFDLSNLHIYTKNIQGALPYIQEVKNILTQYYDDNKYAKYYSFLLLKTTSLLYYRQDKFDSARYTLKKAIEYLYEDVYNTYSTLSENEKIKYYQGNVYGVLNQFYAYLLLNSSDNKTNQEENLIYAYELVVQDKDFILSSLKDIKNRILTSKDTVLVGMYYKWKELKDKYVKSTTLSREQLQKNKINLDSILIEINNIEKELTYRSSLFPKNQQPSNVKYQEIQNKLNKTDAAIEIIRIDAKNAFWLSQDSVVYMALIMKKNLKYPEMIVLPVGNSIENQYFTNYRRAIQSKSYDELSYNIFWKPVKEKLKGIKTVYLSPDGIYHQINLNTLQNPDTKKYVIDEVQVINVTNTKDILNKHTYTTKNNYLIGNPKFDLEIKTEQDNEKPKQERTFEGFFEGISQLEGAENEVKQISTILPNAKTTFGAEATEEYVKSIKNPRILHIATHGYFRKGQYQSSMQAMLNAGLLFSGVVDYDRMEIRPLDKEDGRLTAFEVMNMELDSTELVVLSACETGLGQVSKEGVYGLQRAFKVAGTQCIIMSLWKVSDEATQLLMTKFYQNWQKKGMNKRVAFETAQKEIRKQYKEPYYWGAFVMIE